MTRYIGGPDTKRNVLIDGNNLLNKAYYAFVKSRIDRNETVLCANSGYPTGLIYGSLSMYLSWISNISGNMKVSVFFDGYPSRRKNLDSTYKSNRVDTPSELKFSNKLVKMPIDLSDGFHADSEMSVFSHIMKLFGNDVYYDKHEEADDLIASFINSRTNESHIIVSDDKDFFQLLTNPKVVVYRPGSPYGNRFFDSEASENHWGNLLKGKHPKVPPSYVRMFKSLCGDSSDNIIGVDRLRKRVAVPICGCQTVESLFLTGFPGFSISEIQKMVMMRERIELNHKLVGFFDDIDVNNCKFSGSKNLDAADKIIAHDLNISDLCLPSDELNDSPHTPIPNKTASTIPIADWLTDL